MQQKKNKFLLFCLALIILPVFASTDDLTSRIRAITERPEFSHSMFGIHIYSLSDNEVLYSENADKFFVPGSVTKIVTEAAILELLGPDYRFITRVYRTGEVTGEGTLKGDLVLVASGDPNLSNRVQGESISFENDDHSYGQVKEARLVPGDPLIVIRKLAKQVHEAGIRKIAGQIYVDTSLFPQGQKEGGTAVVISPIAINDNVIDLLVTPGKSAGEPAAISAHPATSYAAFVNEVKTVGADGATHIEFTPSQQTGRLSVVVSGAVRAGNKPRPFPFNIPDPAEFARVALSEALKEAGVEHELDLQAEVDFSKLKDSYNAAHELAKHISPPIKEDVKLTLKVSQNLHAAMMPYILGAVLAKKQNDALEGGFREIKKFLQRANLDVTAAVQSDGAGGDALFTPEFIVGLLVYMSKQKTYADFYNAFPILGRDGTLAGIQKDSPVAGKLRAKTGTHVGADLLNLQYVVNGKGLAGYMETSKGKRVAFAVFLNRVPIGEDLKALDRLSATLTEIVSAAY